MFRITYLLTYLLNCLTCLLNVADKAGGNVQPERGRIERNDVSLTVPQLPSETRSSSATENQPGSRESVRPRYGSTNGDRAK